MATKTPFRLSLPVNKKPANRKASAAGKYLIQMDLPLACREPSPPNSLHRTLDYFLDVPLPAATRARFEFAGCAHCLRIHSTFSDRCAGHQ
jgi:hypothetical protein